MTAPRYAKAGEALAIMPSLMHQDRRGFFWMLGSGSVPNERRGANNDVALIHVRGELEHHEADAYGCESYEGIRRKWADALAGGTDGDEDADDALGPPKAIVMVIDSPGGVVSGLNETVKAIQRLRREHPEVKTIAYCNEMAASAAYALACACEKIVAPPSAIVGSIGVISTMVSQAARDKKEGFDVRLLTSGARKADGHMHAPISDAAVQIEQRRVEKLADAFFRIVSKARRLSVEKIRALQAGIYLGKDAPKVGLVDEVKSLDDVIAEADAEQNVTGAAASGGNQTDRKVKMNLAALIKRTEAAIKKEQDPEKLSALYATLAGYKKVEKHVEHVKTEEQDEEEEESAEKSEESEEESASEDDEEKKAALPDDEDDDEDDDNDEDEKKSAKASLAFRAAVEQLTGMRGKKALGALHAMARASADTADRVRKLEATAKKNEKASLIASVRGKYVTRADAEWLEKQPLSVVRGYVEHAKNRGMIVNTDETTLIKPKQSKPGTEETLPPDVLEMIEASVANYPGDKKALREKLVATHLAEHTKNVNAALNGAGRY